MPWERDPLSVHYDPIAWQTMLRAIRAGRRGAAIRIWIASPTAEFRPAALAKDKAGLTKHERAFSRAMHHINNSNGGGPRSSQERIDRLYALKGLVPVSEPLPQRPGVMVRQLRIRIFLRKDARNVTGAKSYVDNYELRHWQGGEETG